MDSSEAVCQIIWHHGAATYRSVITLRATWLMCKYDHGKGRVARKLFEETTRERSEEDPLGTGRIHHGSGRRLTGVALHFSCMQTSLKKVEVGGMKVKTAVILGKRNGPVHTGSHESSLHGWLHPTEACSSRPQKRTFIKSSTTSHT